MDDPPPRRSTTCSKPRLQRAPTRTWSARRHEAAGKEAEAASKSKSKTKRGKAKAKATPAAAGASIRRRRREPEAEAEGEPDVDELARRRVARGDGGGRRRAARRDRLQRLRRPWRRSIAVLRAAASEDVFTEARALRDKLKKKRKEESQKLRKAHGEAMAAHGALQTAKEAQDAGAIQSALAAAAPLRAALPALDEEVELGASDALRSNSRRPRADGGRRGGAAARGAARRAAAARRVTAVELALAELRRRRTASPMRGWWDAAASGTCTRPRRSHRCGRSFARLRFASTFQR